MTAELRRLMEAATPGPWIGGGRNEHGVVRSPTHGLVTQCGPLGRQDADAALIVAMHEALPFYLALEDAARAYVAARDIYVECDDDQNEEPCGHWHDQHAASDALSAALDRLGAS